MAGDFLPVMQSRLPEAEAITPYLHAIDRNQKYCNFGPLEAQLRDRLGESLGLPGGRIVTFCNGTLALTCALKALNLKPGALCIVPAWTFTATAGAVLMAGLTPYFTDVDEESWALTPQQAERALKEAPGEVACVIPVSPFGDPVDTAAWETFHARNKVPVLVDAAGAYDSFRETQDFTAHQLPVMISLHGTKPLGIGEGGMVLCPDEDYAARLRAMTVFGFQDGRDSLYPATNAKISEYTAAVGLAAMDCYVRFRTRYVELRDEYSAGLNAQGVKHRLRAGWFSATCNIVVPGKMERLEETFRTRNIETRRWWERGCHRHTAYASCPRGAVPVTERLAEAALGIPFYHDMTAGDQQRVLETIAEGIGAAKPPSKAYA